MKPLIVGVLAVWFGLVFFVAVNGGFVGRRDMPPIPILIGVLLPLAVFVGAYRGSNRFKAAVLAADLELLTAVQAWRAGGLVFLTMLAYGLLPGLFAWPAGLGDIAIGVTAPWMALALVRQPAWVNSRRFAVWNLLGILDLVVAVSMGGLCSGFAASLVGEVTTEPMARLPLVLIPGYLVPLVRHAASHGGAASGATPGGAGVICAGEAARNDRWMQSERSCRDPGASTILAWACVDVP